MHSGTSNGETLAATLAEIGFIGIVQNLADDAIDALNTALYGKQ